MAERGHQSRRRLAAYAVGLVRGRGAARVAAHLRECAACRAEVERLREAGRLVESAGLEEPPARVDEAVRAYAAAHPRRARGWRGLRVAAVAAAAALVVAVGSWLGLRAGGPALPVAPYDARTAAYRDGYAASAWRAPLADRVALSAVIIAEAAESDEAR